MAWVARWAALLLLAVAGGTSAQQPTAAALAKKVDQHYNHLHSLEARYTERYQGMGMDRTETGTLTLEKPGRMRWAYDMPAGKVFILDGTNAISYTPGDAEATRFPEKKLDDLRSPLRFLLGHTELEKELHGLSVTLVNLDGQTGYTLWGTPVGIEQRVRSLAVTVDAAGLIHILRIEETDGAITTFTFSDMRENAPVSDDEFRFIPPDGVTVIDGGAPV
ncbi:MAG TPA: outer membrane lipoprotein carrier protein LolA [Acidobacteriaceae bacterium]|nr:outer membrane lipoprotein carrier protein LolA [Acidobacteriaceae bacterium]